MKTTSFRSFTVDFPASAVADLHRRIDAAKWPEMPFDTGWSAGTNDRVLRDLVRYWRHDYDWPSVQTRLNRLAHFRGPVAGEQVHFVRYRAEGAAQSGPLLLLHGWPSSFLEFEKIAPRLARAGFEVVVPSLPGFVFSDAPRAAGMNPTRIAERMHALMRALGFDRYGVHGGDWGGPIGREIARLFPEAVTGLHLNIAPWMALPKDRELTTEEKNYTAFQQQFGAGETAYWSVQGTKPQTLGYGLQDSPVGLLAWILEKFWAWSDHGDDLWQTFHRDEILTTVTLYWFTGRALSAARIYHEAWPWWPGDQSRVVVPTGFARFPKEPWRAPRSLLEPLFNITHFTEMRRGGHFAALEAPDLLFEDLLQFFGQAQSLVRQHAVSADVLGTSDATVLAAGKS